MAPLDPDPYWEYGSRSRTIKMMSKKEKNVRFPDKKSIDRFVEDLLVFT